jgi:hypothetical protein
MPGTIPAPHAPDQRRRSALFRHQPLVLGHRRCRGASGIWATYQQWRRAGSGGQAGEIGTHVILWKKVERADAAEAGGEGDSPPASSRAASSSSTAIRRWRRAAQRNRAHQHLVADALTFEGWRPWPARRLLPP